jgi:hypothetical protein
MKRAAFVAGASAAAVLAPFPALGATTTQDALFARTPPPRNGAWVRLVMDAGVAYQKQIGLGVEDSAGGGQLFVETQIGMPGGACNPNTLKKTYLRATHFSSLLASYPVLAHVASSGTVISRWGDAADGGRRDPTDARLHLIDAKHVYDPRPCTVVASRGESVRVRTGTYATTRVTAAFERGPSESLERIDLWTNPAVPFGVVRYRATLRDLPPFEIVLDSFGRGYKTDLAMTLQTIRAMTPGGTATLTR